MSSHDWSSSSKNASASSPRQTVGSVTTRGAVSPLSERSAASLISRSAETLEEICREETAELARLSVGLRVVRGLLS